MIKLFLDVMKPVRLCVILMILIVSACELNSDFLYVKDNGDGIVSEIHVPYFLYSKGESSSSNPPILWEIGDEIGIFSYNEEDDTQNLSQLMLSLTSKQGTSATYSQTCGWNLISGGTYSYVSYAPYSLGNQRDQILVDYKYMVQEDNNSTEGLGKYDFLYSDRAVPSSPSEASFNFHHIGSLVNINITVPPGYENETFYKMRLYADSSIFTNSASYSVRSIIEEGEPIFIKNEVDGLGLSFGEEGIKPQDGVINAWIMMFPSKIGEKQIKVNLYSKHNNVPTCGGFLIAESDQEPGLIYTYDVTAESFGQILPDRPVEDEVLHILLFGHSFGLDCTEYLPSITLAAGIKNVHYGRWYQSHCSLSSHWGHIVDKDKYQYVNCKPGKTWWEGDLRKVDDVLQEYPWDIIIFQQDIGFGGEGNYSSYQPHLNYLTDHVIQVCTETHGKIPVVGWNMFWGYNSDYSTVSDIDATKMYNAIVKAAKDMMADTEIRLVVPPGTGIQNARGTSLNTATAKLLTRDGYHASYGLGRYIAACTWFQYLLSSAYGIDITGNTYRPTTTSFTDDLVTDERAAICWKCAIEAVKHPFEVTPIEE